MTTFMDKRRNHIVAQIALYGGDTSKGVVQEYLQMWIDGRLREVDVDMIIAKDHGATSEELAEQFGFRKGEGAAVALNAARKKVEEGRSGR